MSEKVFLNDRLVDTDKARIASTDSGFLYGAGLFETMRSCNGVVFGLKDHLDRLFFSAGVFSIRTPTRELITNGVYQTLKANKLTDARLRLTLTNGPMSESEENPQPTLLITAAKFQSYPEECYKKGISVVLCPYKQNPYDPTYGHKTISYFPRLVALEFARKKRAAEALWFTVDNRLAEGCISNVFLVKGSILYTPPIETPVLAGVSRKTICQIAARKSVDFIEKDLHINDLLDADEIFLTNVIMQVMPICKVEKHTVGKGQVGPITRRLQQYFEEAIKTECGQKK